MPQLVYSDSGYFSRSWQMLTREKGWFKVILLMGLAMLVPIVGPLGVMGYCFEWARLTAWGVDSSPKQHGINIGDCIKSGFRVFVVSLVWGLVCGFAIGLVQGVFSFTSLAGLVALLGTVCTWAVMLISLVAAMHATVYSKVGAGFKISRIIEMFKRGFGGLLRIVGFYILAGLIAFVVFWLLAMGVLVALIPSISNLAYSISYYSATGSAPAEAMHIVGGILSVLGPAGLLLMLFGFVYGSGVALLSVNMLGLWMLQFDVPSWGGPDEPLPEADTPPTDGAPVVPVVPAAPSASSSTLTSAPVPQPAPAPAPAPAPMPADLPEVVSDERVLTPAPIPMPAAPAPQPAEQNDEADGPAEPEVPVEIAGAPEPASEEVISLIPSPDVAAVAEPEPASVVEPTPADLPEVVTDAPVVEAAPVPAVNVCAFCGKELPEGAKFCPACGTPIV